MSEPVAAVDPTNPTKPTVSVPSQQRGVKREKQGHKCCGCCCDVRRAVIVVNIIMIVAQVLSLIVLSTATYVVNNTDENTITDDETKEALKDAQELPWGAILAMAVVGLFAYIIGIVGALKYNVYMVGFTMLIYVLSIVFTIINQNYPGIILPILFMYPHIVLIQEINAGTMSEENYKMQEEHSCCCVQV